MTVVIITFCRKAELFYGTELIFKTLRIGFPTADVLVIENGSLPDARSKIEELAHKNRCDFFQNDISYPPADIMEKVAMGSNGTVVFVDPDVVFWQNCENFEISKLLAGRIIPAFFDPYAESIARPRIHPSFFWINDSHELRERILELRELKQTDFRPFHPWTTMSCWGNLEWVMLNKEERIDAWIRYDTLASMYAVFKNLVMPFNKVHLDSYDHLFCGSHFDWIYPKLDAKNAKEYKRIHDIARSDNLAGLRGIWRTQEEFFDE
jgi:hypothetical protein